MSARAFRTCVVLAMAAVATGSGVGWAQDARDGERSGVVDVVVPTGRQGQAVWRYTVDAPGEGWASAGFDDSGWRSGRAGFGSGGTPGIAVNTPWTGRDIWLRREVTVPASVHDLSAVRLLAFHDEDAEIYFDGVLAARLNGYVREYEPVEILPDARKVLRPGATFVLAVHCRQTDGGQGIDVGLATVSPAWVAARRKEQVRAYALSHPGDPAAGQRLFADAQRLACARCHTTDGSAGRAGPDLFAAGDKFTRRELIDAILEPSASIAVGYTTTVVTTTGGDALVGVVKEASDEEVGLMGADGELRRIPAADVRSRRTTRDSLMPAGQEAGLTPEEFSDLVAYLASLRLPAMAGAARQGMPEEIPALNPPVRLVPINGAEDRFNHPCWVGQVPGEAGTFLVCEHETGRVWRLATSAAAGEAKTLWGDFRKEVRPGGATGLLGLAFHPHFRENRRYFIQHQVVVDGRIYARVSEKLASEDLTHDSGRPSRTIIEFPCSTDVHSGGGIEFGPDGFLYIGMGDTGPQGDPEGHGQDLGTPLGKMLRIDVDHEEGGRVYAVPADNPFRSRAGVRPEIWAYGFREPWRFSFDGKTGDLWVGDVGQDRIEEVDVVRRGENYGWNVYEGFDLFSTRRRSEGAAYVPPVFAYTRRLGNSITGGYVYRGGAGGAAFEGVYVCGDFSSRRVWGLRLGEGRKLAGIWQLCRSPEPVASFGRDEAGALYLVGYEGTIYRLDFAGAGSPSAEGAGSR